jgi:NAD(P)-dependent dehydrogenase (short-subunit alcohol dehydrogenase family)
MDVLVTGADSELGRTVAETFRAAGHQVVVSGVDRAELELVAKELEVDAVVCDPADPASLASARAEFPSHLDTIVTVPGPSGVGGDPRAFSTADTATAWRAAFDRTVLSAVLTVHTVADNLRSGGSIVTVVADSATDSAPESAAKAALADWTAGQSEQLGIRGITINVVACGRNSQLGYSGLAVVQPPVPTEIARLALFLATPAARHITGQTLHVGRGAAASYG